MSIYHWVDRRQKYVDLYGPNGLHYRCGTVPHTRKFKASGRYFRQIYTMQEVRYNSANFSDEDLKHHKVRLSRRADLPSGWDDQTDWSRRNRNWKQFRRTRWL